MTELSFVMSAIALGLYSLSYFFDKRKYLALQVVGNIFLALSYLLIAAYFTMVSVVLGIARGVICYIYEKREKSVPVGVVVALCFVTVFSFIIDYVVLSQASSWDFFYLLASCLYAITFTIRNIRIMRYVVIIPHSCAIAYNLLIKAPISSAVSYGIELAVAVIAIIRCEYQIRHLKS